MTDKPYIEAREVSPFGDVDEDYITSPNKDLFDMPGYSDKRVQREIDIRDGKRPDPLNFRLQGIRKSKIDGSPDKRKAQEYRARGYQPLTPDKAKELGLEVEDSAWEVDGDNITLNEYVMFYAPREVAARDNKKLANINSRQQEESEEKMKDAVERFNVKAGLSKGGGSTAIFELED